MQSNDDEDVVVAIQPEDVPAVIEQLRQCLARYEVLIAEDPGTFEGEEQLTLRIVAR